MPVLAGLPFGGPWELAIILLIVVLVFGVGRLPEVGGAIGKSIREFRRSTKEPDIPDIDEPGPGSPPAEPRAASAPAAAAPDTIFCGDCGNGNPRGNKFCSSCGHSLAAPVG